MRSLPSWSKWFGKDIGAVASFKKAVVVNRLPKTRSGKVLRGTMRKIADSEPYSVPATIDDPTSLGEIEQFLKQIGYARKKNPELIEIRVSLRMGRKKMAV